MKGAREIQQESQIQVIIRIKPVPEGEGHQNKCVEISSKDEQTLILESVNKKDYFSFDNVADGSTSQQSLYSLIGPQILRSSLEGYNCCLFSYGQTGAGKTYSIIGQDIQNQSSPERGILPRLLTQFFQKIKEQSHHYNILCTYLEIYNEQVFDLLLSDSKSLTIREDIKKGVYADGTSEENVHNYEESLAVLLKGIKNRRMASTLMNRQSSRSHTIFTIYLESEVSTDELTKTKKSKISIVDLAGSERIKHTKVQGERLKEGCNINKSLHVLGNVINSLVESAKKKRYIPFRDSKLTYILKDSISGNSITKLLANIQPHKLYLGDTLSTLMFAKRVKILKMKVEPNESMTENFQILRHQIKKLREELAEAKYIKNQSKFIEKQSDSGQDSSKFVNQCELDAKEESHLQIFQENQFHYKVLIDIYQEHYKHCQINKNINKHQEWKNIQKKNQALTKIIKNMPVFAKIFKENIMLKKQINKSNIFTPQNEQKRKQYSNNLTSTKIFQNININEECEQKQKQNQQLSNTLREENVQKIIQSYELLIDDLKTKFQQSLHILQRSYEQLWKQSKLKEEKIKDLIKKKQYPPDLENLINQIEYLKLNVMELEDELRENQQHNNKQKQQYESKKKNSESSHNKGKQSLKIIQKCLKDVELEDLEEQTQETERLAQNLITIRQLLIESDKNVKEDEEYYLSIINLMKVQLLSLSSSNVPALKEENQNLKLSNKELVKKINILLKIDADGDPIAATTFYSSMASNQESNYNLSEYLEDFDKEKKLESNTFLKIQIEDQTQKYKKLELDYKEQTSKSLELSHQIIKLHQEYSSEISSLKKEIREIQSENKRYKIEIQRYQTKNRYFLEEYGKDIFDALEEYRDLLKGLDFKKEKAQKHDQKQYKITIKEMKDHLKEKQTLKAHDKYDKIIEESIKKKGSINGLMKISTPKNLFSSKGFKKEEKK